MVWMAALYLTASPMNGSASPMCVFAVLHPARAKHAAAVTSAGLKHRPVILFKADGFLLRHSADRRSGSGRRPRRRRSRRLDERPGGRGHTGVGAPVDEQVGLVWWPDAIGWNLQRSRRNGPEQPRRDDDHQFRLFVLKAGRAKQRADNRKRTQQRDLAEGVLKVL